MGQSKPKREYNYVANRKLSNYVRLKYRNQLSNGALQIYLLAMPFLEEKQSGFCRQVTATYRQIAAAACKDASNLKKALLDLNEILCEIKIGKPIKNGKIATVFRRYSLDELKEEKRKSKIIDKNPVHATRLSAILESRQFVYGEISNCKPYWSITKTGRVVSYKPDVQGDSKKDRVDSLRCGLQKGQVVFDLDIKQAEPSIIQQALDYKFPSDPYELLAKVVGVDRQAAKPKINMLAYAPSAVNIIRNWTEEAQKEFTSYAEALDRYKAVLWESGKPKGRQRRFAQTFGGSRIYADRGQHNHKGKILHWHIQGTVADIINAACLEIIQRERSEGWKLLFPEHDGIYVMGKIQHSEELKQVIIKRAKSLSLDLLVNIKSHTV